MDEERLLRDAAGREPVTPARLAAELGELGLRRGATVIVHTSLSGIGSMFGERSPLARLYDLDAQALLAGVGHGNNTSIHLGEHRADFPGKRSGTEGAPMLVDGERQLGALHGDPARGRRLRRTRPRLRAGHRPGAPGSARMGGRATDARAGDRGLRGTVDRGAPWGLIAMLQGRLGPRLVPSGLESLLDVETGAHKGRPYGPRSHHHWSGNGARSGQILSRVSASKTSPFFTT